MCLPFPDLAERTLERGEHAGLMYEIVHNSMGYRCGYVRVLPGHPWFGKDYDSAPSKVHGGLTFAAAGKACPTHGEADEWWLGFDCAHAFDAKDPALLTAEQLAHDDKFNREFYAKYPQYRGVKSKDVVRTQEYVRGECFSLAEQAAAACSLDARVTSPVP